MQRPLTGLLTVSAVVQLRGVSRQSVLKWVAQGRLRPAAVGASPTGKKCYLFRRADVLAFAPVPPGRPRSEGRGKKHGGR